MSEKEGGEGTKRDIKIKSELWMGERYFQLNRTLVKTRHYSRFGTRQESSRKDNISRRFSNNEIYWPGVRMVNT